MINQSTRRSLLTALATIPAVAAAGQAASAPKNETDYWYEPVSPSIKPGDVVTVTYKDAPNVSDITTGGRLATVKSASRSSVWVEWFDERGHRQALLTTRYFNFQRWTKVGTPV